MKRALSLCIVLAACGGKDDPDDVVQVPLEIEITQPASGLYIDGDAAEITGTAQGTDGVYTLNGVALSPVEGAWSSTTSHAALDWSDSPLWPVLASATSPTDWARDRITLLKGSTVPAADPVKDGLTVRLTDHLLTSLRPAFEELIVELDLAATLVTGEPVTSALGSDIYVDRMEYASLTLGELNFSPSGMAWGATIETLDADVRAEVPFIGTQEWNMTADKVIITGRIVFGANGGALELTAEATDVELENFVLDGASDTFGLAEILAGFLTGSIEDVILEQLDSVLAIQDDLRDLDLAGVSVQSNFTSAVHDDNGVNLYADSTIATASGALTVPRLSNPNIRAQVTHTEVDGNPYGIGLLLDDDLISGLGAGLFEGGALEITLDGEDSPVELTTTALAGFIEEFEDLPAGLPVTIATQPVVGFPATPSSGAPQAAQLHVGGLELDFQVDADSNGTTESQMVVVVDTIVGLSAGDALLDFDLVELSTTMTRSDLGIEDPAIAEQALEGLFGALMPGVLSSALEGGMEDGALEGLESVASGPAGPAGDVAALYFNIDPSALLEE